MTPSHLSPFQFSEHPDGSPRLDQFPGLKLETVEQQGQVTGRDWQHELGMPHWFEEWEALATITSARRHGELKFVLMDHSATNLPGHPRLNPTLMTLPTVCPLELAHTGFIVGMLYAYILATEEGRPSLPTWLHLTLPPTEGDVLIGFAQFINSGLAKLAQEGLRRKIFTHVCPTVFKPEGAPDGTGLLVQVSLVPGDYPGIENARIFSFTE